MGKQKLSVNGVLSYCILVIVLIIIIGTFVFFVGNLFKNENSENSTSVDGEIVFDSKEVYKKLGKIRTSTKDGIPLVVSIYFPFDKNDTEFYEEISVKNESLKAIISGYFVVYTYDDLKTKGENFIKEEILRKMNDKLVLSKIEELFFEEFVYFD
jgi:flagellar basal body-associated protein FliL